MAAEPVKITDAASIQKAIDARPGEIIDVPAGTYEIDTPIVITSDGSGLSGSGRIVQTNPKAPILRISNAKDVRIRDLTLTRSPDRPGSTSALMAGGCDNLSIEGVRVLDNRAPAGAINLDRCIGPRVMNCDVINYARISIDDRTASLDWGYAFNCIDGTGIQITYSKQVLVQGNRVIEREMVPTPELKEKYALGKFVKKNPQKGLLPSQATWDRESVDNWHQGSAIIATGPEVSDDVQIIANRIENAGQGIDLHCDHAIVANNVVRNAAVGMKAMHGSRNTLITGNQFISSDLWAIGLMPGAGSHPAKPPGPDGKPVAQNVDGGSIIANNIISEFGYGNANWLWGHERSPIILERGQKDENPPLRDVVVQGNVVYDSGRDDLKPDGTRAEPPRFRWAFVVQEDVGQRIGPKNVRLMNNIFHPGAQGVSNIKDLLP
ncbi:hypothetical protein IPV69_11945 [Humisphaera borealis]|uniref:Right handed beta helix domain-containing protein n=1 Tax=Humisphaera borealis TaxID=2807512 RepID=A0A7M2X5T1_9BACT|nr:hypothetical protein IPV69_11945 [Humisphaera borealis]